MIQFLRTWRDADKKDKDGFGQLYLPLSKAKFNAVKEQKLISQGTARKVGKDKEDKNASPAPNTIETK